MWIYVPLQAVAHVQKLTQLKPIEYCTLMLVKATTPHRPEPSVAFCLKAVYEYRTLAPGQCKRHFNSEFPLVSLVLAFFFRTSSLAPGSALGALPALISPVLFLILVLVVNDLHLQAANVERYGAQPEEGSAGHHSRLEQHSGEREEHDPPQSQKTDHVWRSTERHTHSAQDEERCGTKGTKLSEQEKDLGLSQMFLTLTHKHDRAEREKTESMHKNKTKERRKRCSTISSLSAHIALYKRNNADPCCQETIPEPGQKSCRKQINEWTPLLKLSVYLPRCLNI